MSDPESKARHRRRRRNKVAKDLRTPKYQQRVQKKRPPKEAPKEKEWNFLYWSEDETT